MDHSGHGEHASQAGPQDEAGQLLAILRRRFAQGEITDAALEEPRQVRGLTTGPAAHGHENH